jgi:hypothetical protein
MCHYRQEVMRRTLKPGQMITVTQASINLPQLLDNFMIATYSRNSPKGKQRYGNANQP